MKLFPAVPDVQPLASSFAATLPGYLHTIQAIDIIFQSDIPWLERIARFIIDWHYGILIFRFIIKEHTFSDATKIACQIFATEINFMLLSVRSFLKVWLQNKIFLHAKFSVLANWFNKLNVQLARYLVELKVR